MGYIKIDLRGGSESTKDDYSSNSRWGIYVKKGCQQKMNMQKGVGYVKKGWIRKSTDEYPTGGGPCQKRDRGLAIGIIQPGRHQCQLAMSSS